MEKLDRAEGSYMSFDHFPYVNILHNHDTLIKTKNSMSVQGY